jgi:HEAT repeat protein
MRNTLANLCFLGCFALSLFRLETMCLAQEQKVNGQANTSLLIERLEDKDERVVVSAAQALVKEGSKIIPSLVEVLQEKKRCQLQFVASGIIYRLEPKHVVVNSTLIDIIKGRCKVSSPRDLIIRRQAAFALVAKPEGIPIIAEILKDKDTFIRRSAAFAFDELTERLEGRPPQIAATPEIISATKAALPILVQTLNDKDEVVRCMSFESLEQIQRSKHEELRSETNRLMQAVTVRCSR